jgi:hypothetical protein
MFTLRQPTSIVPARNACPISLSVCSSRPDDRQSGSDFLLCLKGLVFGKLNRRLGSARASYLKPFCGHLVMQAGTSVMEFTGTTDGG